MKVNGRKGIKMAVQDEFSTMEFVIRRRYKAHDHRGYNHMKNTAKKTVKKKRNGVEEKAAHKKSSKIIMTRSPII